MRIEFTLTQDDIADLGTLVAHDENVRMHRRKRTISTVFFVGLAVVFFMIIRKDSPPTAPPPTAVDSPSKTLNLTVFAICLFLAIGSLIWIFVVAPRRKMAQFLWENLPDLKLPRVVELNEQGITQSTSVSTSTWKWNVLRGTYETDRLIVVRLGDAQSILIPKSAVPADQLDALRARLRQSVAR